MPEADKMKTSPVTLGPRILIFGAEWELELAFYRVIRRHLLGELRMVVHYSRAAFPPRLVPPRGCRREQSIA